MGVFRLNIVWICVVFIVVFCVEAETDSGECVKYYLCDLGGKINTDGRNLIKPRKGIPTCEDPIDVWCYHPEKTRNSTGPGRVRQEIQTPTLSQDPSLSPPETDIPERVCGVRRNTFDVLTPNHSNGVNTGATRFAEFPWMIVLLIQDGNNPSQFKFQCGASLIHPTVVATAAHCVSGVDEKTLKVRAGDWDILLDNEEAPHQDRLVQRIHVHPEFDAGNLHNDIALIIVDSPFNFTGNVDTICLPLQNANFDNSHCVVTGWGKDSFGDRAYRRILRKVDLTVIPRNECEERFRETRLGRHYILDESFTCAGGEVGKNTCQGDGGSPLVCPRPQDPTLWTQVGIVSWGLECNDTSPAVFTNFSYFVNWVISYFPRSNASSDPLSDF